MKCFVIAMESEAAPVVANMTDVAQSSVCGKNIYEGTLCGSRVCVIVCGVGKVNAACGAQLAIDMKSADCIINIGVAGALNGGLRVGGIYCISAAVQYDFDLVQLNHTPIGTLNEFNDRWLRLETVEKYAAKKLATGDRFNDSEADYRLLTGELGADIRDMEGGAIAQTCAHAGVPMYSFKAISDIAGSGSTTDQFLSNLELCARNLSSEIPQIFEAILRASGK